jgi:hypothetical protein
MPKRDSPSDSDSPKPENFLDTLLPSGILFWQENLPMAQLPQKVTFRCSTEAYKRLRHLAAENLCTVQDILLQMVNGIKVIKKYELTEEDKKIIDAQQRMREEEDTLHIEGD